MKITNLAAFILVIFFSCKKETKAPVATTPPHQNACSASLNGVNWSASTEGLGSGRSGNNNQSFSFMAQTGISNPYSALLFSFPYKLGSLNLAPGTGTISATYKDISGNYFPARTGTINITSLDSSQYGLKKMQATFSFNTDTIGGKSYSITGGVIDYISN